MITSYQEYCDSVHRLVKMSEAYYTDDNPIASDFEYDKLYKEVQAYEIANPAQILAISPTQNIGHKIKDEFGKKEHISRMWSLEDIFDLEDLINWAKKTDRMSFSSTTNYTMSPKFDGVSLNLIYENGNLTSAITRGDGLIGEEVTSNALIIGNIPHTISYKNRIEIRGEVVIKKQDFDKINEERAQGGLSLFANPRNMAAGSLRTLDANITKSRNLNFIPWGIGDGLEKLSISHNDSLFDCMNFVLTLGFRAFDIVKATSLEEISHFYNFVLNKRDDYPIMLDGMVIVIDSISSQRTLGYTIKAPRFACAYKFPAVEKETKLLDVVPQIGRSGIITPVAVLEPVNIQGATITRATLHNYAEIRRKDLRIGDIVLVIRSGDVIPKIIKPIEKLRKGDEKLVPLPSRCPICDSTLLVEEILIKCDNLACKARIREGINYFVSKKCANIDGLGDRVIDLLLEKELISNILDLYELKIEDLLELEGFKDKKAQNIIDAIQGSKSLPMWRFINSLGIEHIGEASSKILASKYGLEALEIEDKNYIDLDGFGEEMERSIRHFCTINSEFIKKLFSILNPVAPDVKTLSDEFAGEIIVLTGDMGLNRDEIKSILESKGAKVTSSVSKKTNLLIYGKNAGSKLENAEKLGIRTIEFEDIKEKILS